jgi:hypothetical protein
MATLGFSLLFQKVQISADGRLADLQGIGQVGQGRKALGLQDSAEIAATLIRDGRS